MWQTSALAHYPTDIRQTIGAGVQLSPVCNIFNPSQPKLKPLCAFAKLTQPVIQGWQPALANPTDNMKDTAQLTATVTKRRYCSAPPNVPIHKDGG